LGSTTAIVVASALTSDPVMAGHSSNGSKSMALIKGRPAVSYVMENLRACEGVGRIVMVSDRATYESVPGADFFVEATSNETESLINGVKAACDSERCFMITGDLPLASSDAINDLLSFAPDSDVVYPVVEQGDVKQVFPTKQAQYLGAREGRFTGSSSLLFKPHAALSRESLITDLMNARKNPSAMLGMLGPSMAMKIMFGKVAIADLENQLSKAIGATCRVFISHYPELVCSIDSPDDIRMMENELG
jgi:CTP:molybdopterin cytidylyltransferase MocA